ncbi:alpha-ketoacid dehydrogenase subunit alpha/beta [Micropruina sonneratiae]|uniref:alpha-ketoacid dehydrogenase subunit alpha/beta n=1 Tax=Micropruina sonneratiae TaxID=2986940 RepID=UPI0022277818|nr:alpha-ketoacid dehydrogenase subunit alpha/beta [Micropruina sp. KQZ13P-5]MCW3159339.1 thiamine pyrophosphate-dependent enzyme [Micropruina sp. KQZ13P-5]
MPITEPLQPSATWNQFTATEADWDAADAALLESMTVQMHLIRAFEEQVLDLAGQKLINGPAHSSIGQEAGAVGSAVPLTVQDQINGSHRGHHQFLAKALNAVQPDGFSIGADWTEDVVSVLYRTLAEIAGLTDGYCHGRGGSMHLQWKEVGAMGTNAIVGGAVPFATGFAMSHKLAGTDAVSVTYFGDGASNIGSTLEALNIAAAWKLPTIFFIENNQYAVSTTVNESTADPRLSVRGLGFGIPSWRVDGQDALSVKLLMDKVLEHVRGGGGPAVVEADTYRYFHQNGPFPGSAFGYRSKEEEAGWRDRDPLNLAEKHLERLGIATREQLDALRKSCKAIMAELSGRITEADPNGRPGQLRIRPELWPSASFIDVGIRGDWPDGGDRVRTDDSFGADELVKQRFVDTIAAVMHRRMETDDSIVVLGEDVHKLNGGSRGATKGLPVDFPGRVLGTPIAEAGFTGLGGGMALDGRYYPVVELMYADFIWVAADQIFNQIGRARHMFGGDHDMAMLMRLKIGTTTGYGSQHSMDPAGILSTSVGWRIIAPSTALDYVGLLNAAMLTRDPVAVLEHDADLYKLEGLAPKDLDYVLPFGKAAVRREGSAVTLISYLSMVQRCLDAVEESGVDGEVIDLRWLDRASLDWETIEASVKKTNNVVIVEQGAQGTSYGGWLAGEIGRRLFDWLDAPVIRVQGGEAAPSISKALETAANANTDDIVAALNELKG